MSELFKQFASFLPGPAEPGKYMKKNRLDVIFPFYHTISNSILPHIKHLYSVRTVKQFEADLDYLLEHFQPVKMSEYLSGNVSPDPKRIPMVLSFDDGLIQCYEDLLPMLISKGVPATFFLNNAFIDNHSMFFRFKVSLLVEKLGSVNGTELKKAAQLLHCNEKDIRNRLFRISYVEREITDQVAEAWGISYADYLTKTPVYLTSIHIKKMIGEGFEFGSHGIDHPMFSLLKRETTIDHIRASVEDLKHRYRLDYRYFAFPFTDSGVEDSTIDHLFRNRIIDAGFGTAGLKEDRWPGYFQRVPMEQLGKNARLTLRGELNRRRIRRMMGRNLTDRGGGLYQNSSE